MIFAVHLRRWHVVKSFVIRITEEEITVVYDECNTPLQIMLREVR